jgi:hypothetical protein
MVRELCSRLLVAAATCLVAPVVLAAPSVTINQAAAQSDPANASPILFDVVFSESVTGFGNADVSFAGSTVGGALAASVSGAGTTYTVSVTGMSGSGDVVASIPSGVATGASGGNLASTSVDNTVTFDNARPTVTINQGPSQADPTNALPILFTVVFSEPVTGFTGSDVSFAGTTAGGSLGASVSGSGTTYTVSVTGSATPGNIVLSVLNNAATDAVGNTSQASTSVDNSVTFDSVRPTVTINQAASQPDPSQLSTMLFSVEFSEAVTGFTSSDVSFAGSTAGGTLVANVSGSDASYTVTVTGMTSSGQVVASIPANAATDLAGNPSFASTSIDNTVSFDITKPTVTINQAAGQADPASTSPIRFTVVFSEPVTGFAADDVSFGGSSTGSPLSASVSGSGTTYTVTVTGMTSNGSVVASVGVNTVIDAAGNQNLASTSTDNAVAWADNVRPTVTINQAAGQADPAGGSPILFTVVFSEPVSGFLPASISFAGSTAGGTLTASQSGGEASYTISVTGMTSSGTVVVSLPASAATDGAGNPNFASTSTDNTVTFVAASDALVPNPGSVDFGGQSMNTTSFSRIVTFNNTSSTTITPSSVTASANFSVAHNCTSIGPSGSCSAQVFFTPAVEGAVAGTLTVANGASTRTVPLSGVGERSLVTHYYQSILKREPDAGGKGFWEGERTRVVGLGASVNEVWFAMAQQFYFSAEYAAFNRDNTGFVTDLYDTFFNRTPDSGGLSFWVGNVDAGMPREVVLTAFMFSPEFANFTAALFGNTAARAEVDVVMDFYRGLLARLPDNGGFTFWVGRFRTAQCQGGNAVNAEAEAISSAFIQSAEYAARARTNAQYVGDLYNAFLRRGGDLGGVQFWINELNSGARTREQVRQAFVQSAEFQTRVGAVIAQGCSN